MFEAEKQCSCGGYLSLRDSVLRISCLSLGVLLLAVVSCVLDESQALKGGCWLVVEVARHVGNCLARAPRSKILSDASRILDAWASSELVSVFRSNILVSTCGWEETQVTELLMVGGSFPLCLLKSLSQLIMPNLR